MIGHCLLNVVLGSFVFDASQLFFVKSHNFHGDTSFQNQELLSLAGNTLMLVWVSLWLWVGFEASLFGVFV